MAKMTGLGKGLDALFGGASIDVEKEQPVEVDNSKDNLKTLKIFYPSTGNQHGLMYSYYCSSPSPPCFRYVLI